MPATIEKYEMQMLVYALAAEQVLSRPPVEIVLHFLRGNVEQQFSWGAAARRRAIALVNAALGRERDDAVAKVLRSSRHLGL